jgi:hypothetical protein
MKMGNQVANVQQHRSVLEQQLSLFSVFDNGRPNSVADAAANDDIAQTTFLHSNK